MSLASLTRLEACHETLIRALDGNDAEAIESSVAQFRGALEEVRAAGGWRADADIAERAARISRLADAARIRVNFLTDLNSHRLNALNAARGRAVSTSYRRDGRRSA